MKPVLMGISGVVITMIILAAAAYWALSSLWFMWELLPASALERGAVSITAARRVGAAAMASALLPSALTDVEEDVAAMAWAPLRDPVPSEPADAEGIVSLTGWAPGANPSRVVVLPRLVAQRRLPRLLASEGWHVERRGLVVVAHSHDDAYKPVPTILEALRAVTSRRVLASGWPLRPVALWAGIPGSGSALPAGTVVATAQGKQVRLLFIRDRGALAGTSVAARAAVPAADLELTFTGAWLAERLQSAEQVWDPALAQALHFARTQPPFTAQLLQHASGGRILWQGSEAAVQVAGNPAAFISAATVWVQDEERHGRLETRSFRLPDGTVGQERVPGERQPVVAAAPQNGCFAPLTGRTTLWVCQEGEAAVLATGEQLARQVLAQPPQSAGVFMSGAGIRRLLGEECEAAPWCDLQAAQLFGTAERATAIITF